jgi:oligo-1,6-glucosidase
MTIETLRLSTRIGLSSTKGVSPDAILPAIYAKSRDNGRTPVQWDASETAGFTSGNPWIKVNPNYKDINVQQALLLVRLKQPEMLNAPQTAEAETKGS